MCGGSSLAAAHRGPVGSRAYWPSWAGRRRERPARRGLAPLKRREQPGWPERRHIRGGGDGGVAGTPAPGTGGGPDHPKRWDSGVASPWRGGRSRCGGARLTSAPFTSVRLDCRSLDLRGLDGGRGRNCGDSRDLGSGGDGGRSGGHLCVLRAGDLGRVGQSDAGETSDGDDGGSDSDPGGLANTLHKKKTSFGRLKAELEDDGGHPPTRRLHRGNRSGGCAGYGQDGIILERDVPQRRAASVRGPVASQKRRSCRRECRQRRLRAASGQGVHTEHIAQVHEQLVDARLAVQHRNHSQAFAVKGAAFSHLVASWRPSMVEADTPPCSGNADGGPPFGGDPPSSSVSCERSVSQGSNR